MGGYHLQRLSLYSTTAKTRLYIYFIYSECPNYCLHTLLQAFLKVSKSHSMPGLGEQVPEGSQTRSFRSTGVCILDGN